MMHDWTPTHFLAHLNAFGVEKQLKVFIKAGSNSKNNNYIGIQVRKKRLAVAHADAPALDVLPTAQAVHAEAPVTDE